MKKILLCLALACAMTSALAAPALAVKPAPAPTPPPTPAPAAAWPMYRGNAQNSGQSTYTVDSTGTVAWQRPVPGRARENGCVLGADGTVYLVSLDNQLVAYSQDGSQTYAAKPTGYRLEDPLVFAPNGYLYALVTADSGSVNVAKIATSTGEFAGVTDLRISGSFLVRQVPVVDKAGNIYFSVAGSTSSTLFKYSTAKSRVALKVTVPFPISGTVLSPDESTAYVVGNRGQVAAYDTAALGQKWNVLLPGAIDFGLLWAKAAVAPDGTVYVPDYTGLYALDPATGGMKWPKVSPPLGYSNQQAVSVSKAGTVYFGWEDSLQGGLMAVNPDGTVKWQRYVWQWHPIVESYCCAGASIDGLGNLYLGDGDENLVSVDPATGDMRWMVDTGQFTYYGSPAIGSDGRLYYYALNGYLYCIGRPGQ